MKEQGRIDLIVEEENNKKARKKAKEKEPLIEKEKEAEPLGKQNGTENTKNKSSPC